MHLHETYLSQGHFVAELPGFFARIMTIYSILGFTLLTRLMLESTVTHPTPLITTLLVDTVFCQEVREGKRI